MNCPFASINDVLGKYGGPLRPIPNSFITLKSGEEKGKENLNFVFLNLNGGINDFNGFDVEGWIKTNIGRKSPAELSFLEKMILSLKFRNSRYRESYEQQYRDLDGRIKNLMGLWSEIISKGANFFLSNCDGYFLNSYSRSPLEFVEHYENLVLNRRIQNLVGFLDLGDSEKGTGRYVPVMIVSYIAGNDSYYNVLSSSRNRNELQFEHLYHLPSNDYDFPRTIGRGLADTLIIGDNDLKQMQRIEVVPKMAQSLFVDSSDFEEEDIDEKFPYLGMREISDELLYVLLGEFSSGSSSSATRRVSRINSDFEPVEHYSGPIFLRGY
ncbi:MAG: hypothetical protein ACOCXG_03400 [Nanoarchaeota archaeon]